MKRLLSLLLLLLVSCETFAFAEAKPFAFPFIGRWQPAEDPATVDENGFQDIQNLRRDGKALVGVLGHEKLTTNKIDSTYYKPVSGWDFTKDNPQESHVLLRAFNSDRTASAVYQFKTAKPNKGEFETTALHTDTSGADKGRFSGAPGGQVAYCNKKESLIWGGDERTCYGFLVKKASAPPADYWEKVSTNDTDTYVELNGATTFFIGSSRRFNSAKIYIKTANTAASTIGVSEWSISGATWQPVSALVDGTSSGGVALAATGTISWTWSNNARTTFIEDGELLLYWYQVQVYTGSVDVATAIYFITTGEGGFRPMENLWDHSVISCGRFWYHKTGVSDFADNVNDEYDDTSAEIKNATTSDSIVMGFPSKMRGFKVYLENSYNNTAVAGVSVQSWNSGASMWSGVTGFYDGTRSADRSFNRDGVVHWIPNEEVSAASSEGARAYSSPDMLYYYRVTFNASLSADVRIHSLDGIPAQSAKGSTKTIDRYRFPVQFQNRLWLMGHEQESNKGIYSSFESPDIWNGDDAGVLYFGDRQPLTSAGIIYNLFRTTGFEQLIVTKASETFRVYKTEAGVLEVQQISSNLGNVAPLSFAVCEAADVGDTDQTKRNVGIFQASRGFVLTDGATVQDISDDIKVYFDESDSRRISKRRIDDTIGWYDPQANAYHALISSGADVNDDWGGTDIWYDAPVEAWGYDPDLSITTANVELAYSLQYKEWTKIYREDASGHRPLQVGFQVKDRDGKVYTYGAADDGYMYRLEYGKTWAGTGVSQYVHTKDLMLDNERSLLSLTKITNLRTVFKPKTSANASEVITMTHFGDGIPSVSGTSGQQTPSTINMAVTNGRDSQTVILGPALKHSFKLEARTSNLDNGIGLLGLGGYYDSFTKWSN